MTVSNIGQREYALAAHSMKKQLPSQNPVTLAFNGWTSTNNLAITSVIAFNMHRNWGSGEVQLAWDEVDHLFIAVFESYLRMIGKGPTYGKNDSRTFEGSA
jgi:hypothetical protein